MTPEKTFREALAELVGQYSKRYEDKHDGYLVELKSGEYLEIELLDDTNDLDEFIDRGEEEDEDDKEIIYICSNCLRELDNENEECCEGFEVASCFGRTEADYYKYGI